MAIKAILFDMIGTTVSEKDPMFINNCFVKAFGEHKISVTPELIQKNRGRDKNQMIGDILKALDYPPQLSGSIMQRFQRNVEKGIHNFSAAEGARDILGSMMGRGIKVGIGSGLPRVVFDRVFHHLQWDEIPFDYIGISEEVGRGRPHPDMILDMVKKMNVSVAETLKVGDTISDIQEGKNAGVKTVAILSGTQPESQLRDEQPDFIIERLTELRDIVK
jgi:phosphonatase-like hydrolase